MNDGFAAWAVWMSQSTIATYAEYKEGIST
jgi:hypothetical protein